MITQIFQSLVLFPHIKYHIPLRSGYVLWSIKELDLGKISVIFHCGDLHEEVIFIHKDFSPSQGGGKLNNWSIFSDNLDLLTEIISLISASEKEDFNFYVDKKHNKKIPFGVVLTITSKCNLFCNYCFNDYDYPLEGRNSRDNIGYEKYIKIVDILYNYGTRDIILTGGEPFSAPFIWDLLEYITNKGIFIRINTNGTLLPDRSLERLNENFSLNLMVSMHEFNNKDYFEINQLGAKNFGGVQSLQSFENKFEQKVIQLKKIKNYKNITLDFLTILTPKNILFLDKIYEYVLSRFEIKNWHFFRLYSTGTTKGISREMINLAIHKIYKLNNKYDTDFKIVDSVPYCVTKDTHIASQVIDGELSDSHNVKTIITTDGNIQIMSAFDTNLGSIFENDLLEVWQGKYVQDMLNNGFLPAECNDCTYKNQCKGGSRMDANIYNGSYKAFDPLGDIMNKKTI